MRVHAKARLTTVLAVVINNGRGGTAKLATAMNALCSLFGLSAS